MNLKKNIPGTGKDNKELTTLTLEKLKGHDFVAKQYIYDLSNSRFLQQVERNLIQNALKTEGEIVNCKTFSDKVKGELLQLTVSNSLSEKYTIQEAGRLEKIARISGRKEDWEKYQDYYLIYEKKELSKGSRGPKYERINLSEDLRGPVKKYAEKIYEVPFNTRASQVHFSYTDKYFAHTRVEDLLDDKTRRVLELQSDLMQKEGQKNQVLFECSRNATTNVYNREKAELLHLPDKNNATIRIGGNYINVPLREFLEQNKDEYCNYLKISQYNNPTAHFRIVREEIKQASKDGITKLQFPTGETAMKIEGIGQGIGSWNFLDSSGEPSVPSSIQGLKIGREIYQLVDSFDGGAHEPWIISDVLGDGKFKAVPLDIIDSSISKMPQRPTQSVLNEMLKRGVIAGQSKYTESFDISGHADKDNPIYKFYEKDIGSYLKNKYKAQEISDLQGVTWYEVHINREMANQPVIAFGDTFSDYDHLRKRKQPENKQIKLNTISSIDVLSHDNVLLINTKQKLISNKQQNVTMKKKKEKPKVPHSRLENFNKVLEGSGYMEAPLAEKEPTGIKGFIEAFERPLREIQAARKKDKNLDINLGDEKHFDLEL